MFKYKFLTVLSILLWATGVLTTHAQTRSSGFRDAGDAARTAPNTGGMLRSLNLTPAQTRQIRMINREFQPLMKAARERMQAANQALDDAVYGGTAADAEIRAKLGEAQTAHAEWLKTRTAKETALSKLLDANQLARFRELRLQDKRARQLNNQNRLSNRASPAPPRLGGLPRQVRNRRLQP